MPDLEAFLNSQRPHTHRYEPLGTKLESCECGSVQFIRPHTQCDDCTMIICRGCPHYKE